MTSNATAVAPQSGTADSSRESGHYVVTAHRSTAVHDAVRCGFTSGDSTDLITATSTHLHISTLHAPTSTLRPTASLPLRGRSIMCPLPPRSRSRPSGTSAPSSAPPANPSQLLLMHPNSWSTIAWRRGTAVTLRSGALMSATHDSSEPDMGRRIAVHAECAALHSAEGYVRILPLGSDGGVAPACAAPERAGRKSAGKRAATGCDADRTAPFDLRLEERERTLLDMTFLPDAGRPGTLPVLVLLHRDAAHRVHLSSRTIDLAAGAASSGPVEATDVDGAAGILQPAAGGVVVIGARHVSYVPAVAGGRAVRRIPMEEAAVTAASAVQAEDDVGPPTKYLLSDERGRMTLLVLRTDVNGGGNVRGMHIEGLGGCNVANVLVYLDQGYTYVGSVYGDSQLLQLGGESDAMEREDDGADGDVERDKREGIVSVAEEYVGLCPIVDFCLVDLDGRGQSQAVTCSGIGKEGSVRIVRNGIGIHEQADVEIPGIKGLFPLRPSFSSPHDRHLLQSFVDQTRALAITEDDEMEESDPPGLTGHEPTLAARNVRPGDTVVQCTERRVVTMRADTLERVDEWSPSDGGRITVAGVNGGGQVVCAAGGGRTTYLIVMEDGRLKVMAEAMMDQEVSCINLDPWEEGAAPSDAMEVDEPSSLGRSAIVSVGMWNDNTVRMLELDRGLAEVLRIDLGGDTQARSVLMVSLGGKPMILVGLGDGQLVSYVAHVTTSGDEPPRISVSTRKKVSVGTQSIELSPFQSAQGKTCIFLACDRPTIAYSSNGKLLYSNVNLSHEVNHACPFRSDLFPDGLALAGESTLLIGTVDDIQKLHITTRRLGQGPRRIVHHAWSRVFAVACTCTDGLGDDFETANVIIFLDDTTFEEVHRINLEPFELVLSMLSCNLSPHYEQSSMKEENNSYILVGTAFAYPDEDEPKAGRILVYRSSSMNEDSSSSSRRNIRLVTEAPTRGAVYSMCSFQGGSILATVNSKTKLYRWNENDDVAELKVECGHDGNILSLNVKSRGDTAIVGDLMRSVSVLEYSKAGPALEEVARDHNLNWTTAVEILEDDVYVGAENYQNIFTLKRDVGARTDEARGRLRTQGEYYLDELVNKFLRGSLVMQAADTDGARGDLVLGSQSLFVTADGMIGALFGLGREDCAFFGAVERAVASEVPCVGNIDHSEYRSYSVGYGVARPSTGFVDGDLVESFLDLDRQQMEAVVAHMNANRAWYHLWANPNVEELKNKVLTVEEVLTKVEEISRLH